MSVLVVGISHRSAPVPLLERVAVDGEGATKLARDVAAGEHVTEAAVIATCNRLEIYADVDRFHGSVEELSRLLVERAGRSTEDLLPHLYVHYDDGAVSHLFQVAAGLDSMAVGEAQILGQTRDALARGQEAGTVGPALNVLFQQALRVGKRAHAETGIDQAAPTLVTAALDRVGDVSGHRLDDLSGRRTVVIGAGSIAALATATLVRRGATDVVVVNRSPHRAARLAAEYGARAAALADLAAEIEHAELVVACTGSTGVLLTTDMVASLGRPLDVVDLALPHDVEPGVGELPGVTLVTLADLADDLADSAAGVEVDAVREIVAQEVAAFDAARRQASVTPDRRGAALDGHRRGRGRAGPADGPPARPRRRLARRGPHEHAPGRRQAAPPADRPRQGARQRDRRRLLRRRAGRAVRPRPRRGRGRDEARGTGPMSRP